MLLVGGQTFAHVLMMYDLYSSSYIHVISRGQTFARVLMMYDLYSSSYIHVISRGQTFAHVLMMYDLYSSSYIRMYITVLTHSSHGHSILLVTGTRRSELYLSVHAMSHSYASGVARGCYLPMYRFILIEFYKIHCILP